MKKILASPMPLPSLGAVDWEPYGFVLGNDERTHVLPFMAGILTAFPFKQPPGKNLAFITVNHFVPTLPPWLKALQHVGRIAGIIQKGAIPNPAIEKYVKDQGIHKLDVTRGKLADPDFARNLVLEHVQEDEVLIMFDIGGYGAKMMGHVANDPLCKDRVLGVIEDTENGHQKHEHALQQSDSTTYVPTGSVARSEQKKMEDYNVGKAIAHAAATILRQDAHTMMTQMHTVVVLGFGKIGHGIAEYLRQLNITVKVKDTNPIRQNIASSLGYQVATDADVNDTQMLFAATGSQCLKGSDFKNLRDNCFVVSCTSSDDEFDLAGLEEEATEATTGNISTFTFSNNTGEPQKRINLLCRGNAANFAFGGVNGPFIYAVQAALLAHGAKLSRSPDSFKPGQILEPDMQTERTIAQIWSKAFSGSSNPSAGAQPSASTATPSTKDTSVAQTTPGSSPRALPSASTATPHASTTDTAANDGSSIPTLSRSTTGTTADHTQGGASSSRSVGSMTGDIEDGEDFYATEALSEFRDLEARVRQLEQQLQQHHRRNEQGEDSPGTNTGSHTTPASARRATSGHGTPAAGSTAGGHTTPASARRATSAHSTPETGPASGTHRTSANRTNAHGHAYGPQTATASNEDATHRNTPDSSGDESNGSGSGRAGESGTVRINNTAARNGNIRVLKEDGATGNVTVDNSEAGIHVQVAMVKTASKETVDNFFGPT